jgi:hypothetical protein
MAVKGPDECGYVSRDGKVVRFSDADGTLTNYGRASIVSTIFNTFLEGKYKQQKCLVLAGENYLKQLETLSYFYHKLADLKIDGDIEKYEELETKKTNLVKKIILGFKPELRKEFTTDMGRLDDILESISKE